MAILNTPETTDRDTRKGAVLVVDDDLDIRELMRTCLEFEGFDVITASDGLDGLRRYQENRDRVEIVVTDLDMPAMNGSDMIRHIFNITPAMKVIVASGRSLNAGPDRSTQTCCIQKPYTARELTDAVHQMRGLFGRLDSESM